MSSEEAVTITQKAINGSEKKRIQNYEDPQVKVVQFDKQPLFLPMEGITDYVGKVGYQITYNTDSDGLTGPIVFYVGQEDGIIYGRDLME